MSRYRHHPRHSRNSGRGDSRRFEADRNQFAEDIDSVPGTPRSNDRSDGSMRNQSVHDLPIRSIERDSTYPPQDFQRRDSVFGPAYDTVRDTASQYHAEPEIDPTRYDTRVPQDFIYGDAHRPSSYPPQNRHDTLTPQHERGSWTPPQNLPPQHSPISNMGQHHSDRGDSQSGDQARSSSQGYNHRGQQAGRGRFGHPQRGGRGSTPQVLSQPSNQYKIQKPQNKRGGGGRYNKKPARKARVPEGGENEEEQDNEEEATNRDAGKQMILAQPNIVETPGAVGSQSSLAAPTAPGSIDVNKIVGMVLDSQRHSFDVLADLYRRGRDDDAKKVQADTSATNAIAYQAMQLIDARSQRQDEQSARTTQDAMQRMHDQSRETLQFVDSHSQRGDEQKYKMLEGYATGLGTAHNRQLEYAHSSAQNFAASNADLASKFASGQAQHGSDVKELASQSMQAQLQSGSDLRDVATHSIQVQKPQASARYVDRLDDTAEIQRRQAIVYTEIDSVWKGGRMRGEMQRLGRTMAASGRDFMPDQYSDPRHFEYMKQWDGLCARWIDLREFVSACGDKLKSRLATLTDDAFDTIKTTSSSDAAKDAMATFTKECDAIRLSKCCPLIIQKFEKKIRPAYVRTWPFRSPRTSAQSFINGWSTIRHVLDDIFKGYTDPMVIVTSITQADLEQAERETARPIATLQEHFTRHQISDYNDPRFQQAVSLRNSVVPQMSGHVPEFDYFQIADFWTDFPTAQPFVVGVVEEAEVSDEDDTWGSQLLIEDAPKKDSKENTEEDSKKNSQEGSKELKEDSQEDVDGDGWWDNYGWEVEEDVPPKTDDGGDTHML